MHPHSDLTVPSLFVVFQSGCSLGVDLGSSGIWACLMSPNELENMLPINNPALDNNGYTVSANGRVFGNVDLNNIYLEDLHDGHEVVAQSNPPDFKGQIADTDTIQRRSYSLPPILCSPLPSSGGSPSSSRKCPTHFVGSHPSQPPRPSPRPPFISLAR